MGRTRVSLNEFLQVMGVGENSALLKRNLLTELPNAKGAMPLRSKAAMNDMNLCLPRD